MRAETLIVCDPVSIPYDGRTASSGYTESSKPRRQTPRPEDEQEGAADRALSTLASIDELEITCSISSNSQPTISTLGPSRASSINDINCSKEHLRRATVHATLQSKRSSRAPALLTPR
jgi:hypothetical protein